MRVLSLQLLASRPEPRQSRPALLLARIAKKRLRGLSWSAHPRPRTLPVRLVPRPPPRPPRPDPGSQPLLGLRAPPSLGSGGGFAGLAQWAHVLPAPSLMSFGARVPARAVAGGTRGEAWGLFCDPGLFLGRGPEAESPLGGKGKSKPLKRKEMASFVAKR